MELLKFDRPSPAQPETLDRSARILAEIVCSRLKHYPHYTVLRGSTPTADRNWATLLCRTIASLDPQKAGPRGVGAISKTRVSIDSSTAGKRGGITRFSRTNRPMPPHTDSSYLADPHELIVFQIIAADSDGGDSTVVPLEDLLARLSPAARECLRREIFPFGRGSLPILFGDPDAPKIRYYRAQLDLAVSAGAVLPGEAAQALDELDAALADATLATTMTLREGDILFLDNKRALHGRTGFAEGSRRELFRLRAHVGRLV